MQGVTPAGDVSEVEALAGGDMLQEWLLFGQGKLRKNKRLQAGSANLLRALQQVQAALRLKRTVPRSCTTESNFLLSSGNHTHDELHSYPAVCSNSSPTSQP